MSSPYNAHGIFGSIANSEDDGSEVLSRKLLIVISSRCVQREPNATIARKHSPLVRSSRTAHVLRAPASPTAHGALTFSRDFWAARRKVSVFRTGSLEHTMGVFCARSR
jgi:hypothetical protein